MQRLIRIHAGRFRVCVEFELSQETPCRTFELFGSERKRLSQQNEDRNPGKDRKARMAKDQAGKKVTERASSGKTRTIKGPAKPGTLRGADVARAVRKVASQRAKPAGAKPIDRIIDEVKTLSAGEKRQLREALDQALRADEQADRHALVHSVRGKYAHLGLSSEDFAANKANEIELEDRWGKS